MANLNRSLDASQQRQVLSFNDNISLTTGDTGVLTHVPFPCVLQAAQISAFAIEDVPNLLFTLNRFIVGTGFTTYILGSTFAARDYGISGVLAAGISLPATGSTLLNLMANDVLGYVVGGSATAMIDGLAGCFVVRPVQDLRVFLNGLA